MKMLILGTVAAATVITSATVASAQTRTERAERNLFDLSAMSQDQRNAQDPIRNFAPDFVK